MRAQLLLQVCIKSSTQRLLMTDLLKKLSNMI